MSENTPSTPPSGLPSEPPMNGSELDSLLGELERVRRTFAWKTGDLDVDGLRARAAASSMTLGGLLKHLALVEVDWFAVKLRGEEYGEPWAGVDWDADPDWEWHSAADDSPDELYELWASAADRARRCLAEGLADGGLDAPASFTWPNGAQPSTRRIVVDMIEEYARHLGHADLLREAVDGRVGEDAPR
jgi:uncharacterized damage-inducible protein DinB